MAPERQVTVCGARWEPRSVADGWLKDVFCSGMSELLLNAFLELLLSCRELLLSAVVSL